MNVYRKLVSDLLVGDYLQVVAHVPNEDQRPECFRRVEKVEYIEAPANQFFANRQFSFDRELSPRAGPVIVWCHGVSAPLIYPPGDVTVIGRADLVERWPFEPRHVRSWRHGSTAGSGTRVGARPARKRAGGGGRRR